MSGQLIDAVYFHKRSSNVGSRECIGLSPFSPEINLNIDDGDVLDESLIGGSSFFASCWTAGYNCNTEKELYRVKRRRGLCE